MKRKEVIFTVVIIIICLVLLLFRLNKEAVINKNGAYVIGKVVSTDELESGFLYKCKYFYNGKSYIAEFSGVRRGRDSLIFFKISRDYPYKWKYMEFIHVPDCFRMNDVPVFGWAALPTCDSLNRRI